MLISLRMATLLPDHTGDLEQHRAEEKQAPTAQTVDHGDKEKDDIVSSLSGGSKSQWWALLVKELDVESRGIVPTRPEERTDPRYLKIFFIWLSANCNILS